MAFQDRGRREKREQDMGLCNCVVAIFQVMIACQSITFISGQGYLHLNAEFQSRRILQDTTLFHKQHAHGVTSEPHHKNLNANNQGIHQINVIRFEPPFLDFDVESVGMPKLRTVYIHNPNKEQDLQLSSISARTSHFHASFFDKKIIPPGGNTSFEVVFLARVVGNVENTLFINTMYGAFPYQVFGIGIPNPYRLRPYLGAKVPINSTFSPLISMHNPTSETLQVTEMYSSSGYLQLQLPQGQHEGNKEQWEIPPYETKQVIRARFMGQVEANHTAFIRIKTAQPENSNPDFHILPVEVEVSAAPGIYSALELLDFGTLRTRYDEPKTLPLFLLNSGDRDVQINSISLSSSNPAVEIHFKPVKLKPSDTIFTLVANVTFSAFQAKLGNHKGTIIVKSKDKSYSPLEIPFIVNLLDGTLAYDVDSGLFLINEPKAKKEIMLSNLFQFPVVLQNLSLTNEAAKNFKIHDFSGPVTLPVSERFSPFSIEYDPGESKKGDEEKPADVTGDPGSIYYLTLQTNASKFSLPLHTYSGLLSYEVLREDRRKLDFGVMGTMDKREILFALHNHNPAKILLEKINSTLKNIEIRLVSLTQDAGKNLTEETDFKLENFWLPTNSCSVFEVKISASEKEEDISDSIKISTKYQEIDIPVLAKIVVGTLTVKPEKIKFPKSFPGLVVHQTLSVINTFAQSTKLEYVHSKEMDKRFYYKKLKNQGHVLEPNKKAKIGKVYFDARQSCKPDRCYTGLPTSTTVGHRWLTSLALGPDSVEFDTKRYKEHRQRWRNLQTKGLRGPNTTLVLSADVVMNVEVPVQASLYWPSLLEEDSFEFPLTHVGRKTIAALNIVNPADIPVVVQIMPLSRYPDPEAALGALGCEDKLNDNSFIIKNSSVFHILDPRQDTLRDSVRSQMVWLEYTLNGKLNHTAVNLFLDPGDRVELKVEFVPYDDNPKSTVILLRNNLTILEALPMHGRGVYEHLTLGGKAPNFQTSILRFKLTKELLKDCTRKKSTPSFTVRKWFHANNTGSLPIHITSITVSGSPCEGYGFRVLECDQFILQPNTSKKIEIAYTPDFTSYLVLHELKLVTAQGNDMIFTLNVSLPPYMLPVCQEAMPRPSWEPTLYYFIVVVMLVLFVGILLMAYLESINIWEIFIRTYEVELQHKLGKRKRARPAPEGFGKRFDLRNIAKEFIRTVAVRPNCTKHSDNTGKNGVPTVLKPSVKLKPNGKIEDVKQDVSQQTDPHPDYPPLSSMLSFSSYPKGLLSKLFGLSGKKDKARKSSQTDIGTQQNEILEKESCTSNGHAGPRLRNVSSSFGNEKRKNDKKFKNLENFNVNSSVDRHSKPTAEIRPVAKPVEISKRKNSDINNVLVEKLVSDNCKPKDDLKDINRIESEESISRDTAKIKARERRRSRSKSGQHSRESTSSSGSSDLQDSKPARKDSNTDTLKVEPPVTKVEENKPAHGKKLRKPTRKQAKALAREREMHEKENIVKVEPEKPSTPSDEDEKPVIAQKRMSKKLQRQQKRKSLSQSFDKNVPQNEKETEKTLKKAVSEDMESTRSQSSKNEIVGRSMSKHRSRSLNNDVEKPNKITIFKRPNQTDSHSSSSHEVSESSSSESVPLWETPSRQRDVDEDMRMISRQSQQAELLIGTDKKAKDAKRNKGAGSPVHLSSGSRSSSYSSILSSASSNDGATGKSQSKDLDTVTPSVHVTPSKKLSRSMSDASNGSASKPQLRRRSPYPPLNDPSNNSPTHSGKKDLGQRNSSPSNQQPQYLPPTRTLSSPSPFSNSLRGKQQKQHAYGGQGMKESAPPQWTYQKQLNASSYSAFGKSPFNLMENLIGCKNNIPASQPQIPPKWESPFSDNSSLYSTPSPPQHRTPPQTLSMRPLQWTNSNSPPPPNSGFHSPFEAPHGTPTTPGTHSGPPQGLGWGDIPSPTASSMTTHSIWSVQNAVTMDENRNADERDPLGVRSIWSNAQQYQNQKWHERR